MSQNVDPAEIKQFDAAANTWWDLDGPLKTLHHINPTRMQFIKDNASLSGKRVLDVGCGGGILTESLAREGAEVTGVDMAGDVLAVAREHAKSSELNIDYQQTEISDFADKHSEQFDVVTCLELLEHVPDPAAVINACARCLKPGGQLFISTVNRTPKSFLFAIVGAEYVLRLLPRGTHHYEKFIKPSEMHRFARAAKLAVKTTVGMWYQPFSQQSGLHDDLSVNYLMVTVKTGG